MSLPILDNQIFNNSEFLQVQKPAQYMGGESGSIVKNDKDIRIHTCLAFPDTYEVGMSHTGYQILYDLLNKTGHIWAERVYVPLPDMEELLRNKDTPLRSLEAKRPISDFDIVGFSLQYELCMSGILNILDLGNIPLLAKDRDETHPIIIGGGPVAYHPEPFADFFDAFLIGDGEELVPEFHEKFLELKNLNTPRKEKLKELSKIQGVYIPSFFTPEYSPTGKFLKLTPLYENYTGIKRRIISTLENAPFPTKPIIPNIEAVHDRLSVEVMRGCVRGCRFCQAGYLYRPQRERNPDEIRNIVKEALKNSGYEELSLLSLSTADYCSILPLLSVLKEEFAKDDNLAISFPSTRVDALTPELLQEVQPSRRSGFTMAPEGGTQRLRDVINKGVTDEQIITTCTNVFQLGWSSVKLYFMIGLPTETDEDVHGIIDIGRRVKKLAGRSKTVTVSVSTHIPKPDTPFQWAEQMTEGETVRKLQLLSRELKSSGITFRYHDARSSFLEGVFARGDRQLSKVILKAYELGVRLDGWAEELKFSLWDQAFSECDIDPHHYLHSRDLEETLPWEHIDCDIPKRYFKKEWERAVGARTTPDCLTQTCSTCGACDYDATRNVLHDRVESEKLFNITTPPWKELIERKKNGEVIVFSKKGKKQNNENESDVIPEEDGTYSLKDYLRTERNAQKEKFEKPVYNTIETLRLQYTKTGKHRYTSHLELAKIFFRAARRAELPIVFSRGYHPKPKFAFGPPLQLGVESLTEFVDVSLSEQVVQDELIRLYNSFLPEEIQIKDGRAIQKKETSIQASVISQKYKATLAEKKDVSPLNWQEKEVIRRTKRGRDFTRPLAEYVSEVSYLSNTIHFELITQDSGATLKPFEAVEALSGLEGHLFDITKVSGLFKEL